MRCYRIGNPQQYPNYYRHALCGIGKEQDHLPQGHYFRAGRLRGYRRAGHHRLCKEPFSLKDCRYL